MLPALAHSAELKIATWNLDWLTDRPPGDRALPGNVHARDDGDFALLRHYAALLGADVVAVQEVDRRETLARIFPPDQYSIHLARDRVLQRAGVAIRRGLPYTVNPDLTALAGDPTLRLRSGVDVTLTLPAGNLRLLVVHLKQGCQTRSLRKITDRACMDLFNQIPPLRDWIAARQAEAGGFIVLGDFNRQMDGRDPLLAALRQAAPLTRATQGRSSGCWGGEAFIDHILLGGAARDWLVPDSLRVLIYRQAERDWRDRLSDHCPVSVRLRLPEPAANNGD